MTKQEFDTMIKLKEDKIIINKEYIKKYENIPYSNSVVDCKKENIELEKEIELLKHKFYGRNMNEFFY